MGAFREGLGPTQRDGTYAEGLGSAARLLGHSGGGGLSGDRGLRGADGVGVGGILVEGEALGLLR